MPNLNKQLQERIGTNNVCIGINAGFDLTTESNQIRIGNFTDEEVKNKQINDCIIIDNGRIIIKKDILEFMGLKLKEEIKLLK